MIRLLIGLLLLAGCPAVPATAQQESVRPGINERFENPDVKEFVGRFEREGRDAYDHRFEIVTQCRIRPRMAVADVGAGTGLFTMLFAGRVGPQGRVFAVDIAQNFVDHIEEKAKAKNLKGVVGIVSDQQSVKLPAESIDLAFICDTYHHFEFPHKTMRSIHRALRPGGHVILVDFHRIKGTSSEWILGHVRAGQETFVNEIVAAGFKQVEEHADLLEESYFVRFIKVADQAADRETDGG